MKTFAVALAIISLLTVPKVLAQASQAPFHSQAMFHSQGDEHKSETGEDHDKEAWDLEESDDDLRASLSPNPTVTPIGSETPTPTPTPTATPIESPVASPTISPTPTVTPETQGEEEHPKGPFNQIANLLKQILAYLQSLAPQN